MTTVLVARSRDFAVLAADRLVGSVAGHPAELHAKVSLHPTLPIAVASSGLGSLVHPKDLTGLPATGAIAGCPLVSAQKILEEHLSLYVDENFGARSVAEHLAARVQPSFLPLMRLADFPRDGKNGKVVLWVVTARGGVPDAVCIELTEMVGSAEQINYRWGVPPIAAHLGPLLERQLRPLVANRGLFAAEIRKYIKKAIELDSGSETTTIGGKVDVVIVDKHGARHYL